MKAEEAHTLALRYHAIWRGGPSTTELERTFTRIDTPNRANRILDQLARTDEHPPTIAHIWRLHDDTPTIHGWEPPTDTGPVIPPHTGKHIAWQAYVNECRSRLRQPNRDFFNAWFSTCLGHAPPST